MSLTPIADLKAGQRVKWTERSGSWTSTDKRGVILRVTPSTVMIKADGSAGTEVRRNANRRGQVEVEILTTLDLALETWARKRPSTEHVTVSVADSRWPITEPNAKLEIRLDDRALRSRMSKGEITYDAAFRAISRECALLTLWLDERPTAASVAAVPTPTEEPTT